MRNSSSFQETKFKVRCPESEKEFVIDMGPYSQNPTSDFAELQMEVGKVLQLSVPLQGNQLYSPEKLSLKAKDVEDEINDIRELRRAYGILSSPTKDSEEFEITEEELEKLR